VVVTQNAVLEADPRKYVQLAAQLRHCIEDGTLRPGDPVPSITALAAGRGGWARQTCAKALRILEADGLLVRVSGLGYYVTGASTETGGGPQPGVLRAADQLRSRREDL
jgi:DNA-binding GntR family transcriptional regulator